MLIAYCPLWASLRWVCRNPLYTPHHSPQVIIYIRIPLSLLLSGWTALALSVCSHERCSNLSIFVAPDFAWICFVSPLYRGARAGLNTADVSHQCWEEGRMPSCDLLAMHFFGHLCHRATIPMISMLSTRVPNYFF